MHSSEKTVSVHTSYNHIFDLQFPVRSRPTPTESSGVPSLLPIAPTNLVACSCVGVLEILSIIVTFHVCMFFKVCPSFRPPRKFRLRIDITNGLMMIRRERFYNVSTAVVLERCMIHFSTHSPIHHRSSCARIFIFIIHHPPLAVCLWVMARNIWYTGAFTLKCSKLSFVCSFALDASALVNRKAWGKPSLLDIP